MTKMEELKNMIKSRTNMITRYYARNAVNIHTHNSNSIKVENGGIENLKILKKPFKEIIISITENDIIDYSIYTTENNHTYFLINNKNILENFIKAKIAYALGYEIFNAINVRGTNSVKNKQHIENDMNIEIFTEKIGSINKIFDTIKQNKNDFSDEFKKISSYDANKAYNMEYVGAFTRLGRVLSICATQDYYYNNREEYEMQEILEIPKESDFYMFISFCRTALVALGRI